MISIVIPARNEAGAIARTLNALTQGVLPGELDIIVVCNGCTDNTAEIAGRYGNPVRVAQIAIANKSRALNFGDRNACSAFPRIYVDADVEISLDTIRALACRLSKGDVLAVAPTAQIDISGCSWPVRWFLQIASLLPSAKEGIGSSGVYALSRAGRSRFDEFPNLIADDAYVRMQFKPQETETIATLSSAVFPPRKMKDLIRVRTRIRYGHIELARLFPQRWRNREHRNNKAILTLFKQLTLWPKLIIYCYVMIIARIKATRRFHKSFCRWERDDTSRIAIARSSKP